MLKVVVVDGTPEGASALGRALANVEGMRIACTVDAPEDLAKHIEEHRPDIVAFSLRVAMERLDDERRLREELQEARARLDERKLVERAKGILMKQRGTSEDEAFALLRSLAMQRGVRLGEAARQVIDVAQILG